MAASKPLVSIAIVAYEQEDFIEEAMDGALAQDWNPLEVVVADDGSSDRTVEIVKRWQSKYSQLKLASGPNLGITGNCNRSLSACTGEFLVFQGGDDISLPGKISAQMAWMAARPNRVLCGHDVEHFLSSTGQRIALHSELTPPRHGTGPAQFLANGPPFAAPSVMVRRSALPTYGFDQRLHHVSDGKLWIDCLMAGGDFGYVPEVLLRYRRHSASITMSSPEACLAEEFKTLDLVQAEHPEFSRACARGRARLQRREGISALMMGDVERARSMLRNAFLMAPRASIKAPAWLALSYVPKAQRQHVLSLARRLGRARLWLSRATTSR